MLITTDSILHAMHRTYDEIPMEMSKLLFPQRSKMCSNNCPDHLTSLISNVGPTAKNYQDVDLYLTVARNLLKVPGSTHSKTDAW